ncbi:MAG: aldose 1-epimerase family protein [Bacteroidota bacterium]
MTQTLQNDLLQIHVKPKGAELAHVIDQQDQTEYMWEGDPSVWGRHAPVLFPIVGRLKDNQYMVGTESYRLTQHGFARDRTFTRIEQTESQLRFRLTNDPETEALYPFSFELEIGYHLDGRALTVSYAVRNSGEATLPFSLGAHPGFKCPLLPDESLTDYEVVFAQPETLARHLLEGGLYNRETESVLVNQDRIGITPTLFDQDALVFHQPKSEWVALRSRKSGRGVELSLEGWPYLGIWAKPGAPFVCLEPWQGVADYTDASGHLSEKLGMMFLAPGATHTAAYTLRFL